ncbi:cysteine-rich receptor-like protein kinase 26 [Prunus persica]|uniref:cysteine-rich receptor-like protein kinase 26 n=1 Tax=Prunus persica TaxID=3760 RepID=UPI0009AB4F48|nr:cysteine-rich receptor-like protein kinase 26 [Prunus persica]
MGWLGREREKKQRGVLGKAEMGEVVELGFVNGNGYGFYNSSYGENPDQVYAIGLCRGDVTVDNCRGCLSNATQRLTQDCPNQKEAFGVIEQCTLRYSNRSIYGAMETFPALMWYNPQNVTSDVDGFFQELKTLLEDLRGQAAGNGSLRKFAAETATAINFQTIYGLAQCTPDLTEQVCSDCLGSSLADIPKYFQGMQGSKSNRSQTVIIIVVPIVVYVIFFCICLRVRRTKKKLETGKLIQGKDATLVNIN